ncbi:MAG: transketolase, partial [Pseudomonadota bacterium]
VSMPCWELFEAQDEAYRRRVLGRGNKVRVAVEAGMRHGWDRWLMGDGGKAEKAGFVGMSGFGASAPAEVLFEKFGITAEAVVQKVKDLL